MEDRPAILVIFFIFDEIKGETSRPTRLASQIVTLNCAG
jgi:hypothetical protein